MNKDYMTTEERRVFITFKKALEHSELMLDKWKLTKEEHKNLKTCLTFGTKYFDSICKSLSDAALLTLVRSLKVLKLTAEDKYAIAQYNKKIDTNLSSCFEENKDYYRLVELLMHYKCRGCTKPYRKCEIAEEFEKHIVPSSPDGLDNCKYSYNKE